MTRSDVTVAIVQQPRRSSISRAALERAASHIAEAATRRPAGRLPEAWLTCYPAWVFGMAQWDDPSARGGTPRCSHRVRSSRPPPAPADRSTTICSRCGRPRPSRVTVVMGMNERAGRGSGTLYNSLVTIGPDGRTTNLHRKLTPTHTERIVWGAGDAAGLDVCETPIGRVGGLICWEHWNPLARQALHAQQEQIHIAAWPDFAGDPPLAARSYAFEGRCFVLSAAQVAPHRGRAGTAPRGVPTGPASVGRARPRVALRRRIRGRWTERRVDRRPSRRRGTTIICSLNLRNGMPAPMTLTWPAITLGQMY